MRCAHIRLLCKRICRLDVHARSKNALPSVAHILLFNDANSVGAQHSLLTNQGTAFTKVPLHHNKNIAAAYCEHGKKVVDDVYRVSRECLRHYQKQRFRFQWNGGVGLGTPRLTFTSYLPLTIKKGSQRLGNAAFNAQIIQR